MTITIEKAISELKDAERAARMENASFGSFKPSVTLNTAEEIDAYVKEAVKLYMGSWVIGPIRHALTILEANQGLVKASQRLADVLHKDDLSKALAGLETAIDYARQQEYR